MTAEDVFGQQIALEILPKWLLWTLLEATSATTNQEIINFPTHIRIAWQGFGSRVIP